MSISSLIKKLSMATAGGALIVLGAAVASQAASITTTFAHNNGQAGNMFDVTTFSNPINVTSLEINAYEGFTNGLLKVYTKSGSYIGSETDAADWTLVSSNIVSSSAGEGVPTFVDVADFLLSAASVNGIWVTFDRTFSGTSGQPGLRYTNGSGSYANADLRIDTGIGVSSPLREVFLSRTWNGTINYEVVSTAVPEPGSVVSLLAIGAFGAASLRKRKQQKVTVKA